MANIEHFLFNSDYPTDKIVFLQEGEKEITGTWTPIYEYINTHIPTQLYAEGDYRLPGSSSVYPIDGNNAHSESNTMVSVGSFMYQGECWLILLFYTFDSSLIGKKISYRIWSYYDEDKAANIDISKTTSISKPKIAFTSDNNYPRFIGSGYIAQGQIYTHNLGFIPMVRKWIVHKNAQISLPSGSTIYSDVYEPYQSPFFGNARNYYAWGDAVIQVSKTDIKTFIPSELPEDWEIPDGVYFRMYRI